MDQQIASTLIFSTSTFLSSGGTPNETKNDLPSKINKRNSVSTFNEGAVRPTRRADAIRKGFSNFTPIKTKTNTQTPSHKNQQLLLVFLQHSVPEAVWY